MRLWGHSRRCSDTRRRPQTLHAGANQQAEYHDTGRHDEKRRPETVRLGKNASDVWHDEIGDFALFSIFVNGQYIDVIERSYCISFAPALLFIYAMYDSGGTGGLYNLQISPQRDWETIGKRMDLVLPFFAGYLLWPTVLINGIFGVIATTSASAARNSANIGSTVR